MSALNIGKQASSHAGVRPLTAHPNSRAQGTTRPLARALRDSPDLDDSSLPNISDDLNEYDDHGETLDIDDDELTLIATTAQSDALDEARIDRDFVEATATLKQLHIACGNPVPAELSNASSRPMRAHAPQKATALEGDPRTTKSTGDALREGPKGRDVQETQVASALFQLPLAAADEATVQSRRYEARDMTLSPRVPRLMLPSQLSAQENSLTDQSVHDTTPAIKALTLMQQAPGAYPVAAPSGAVTSSEVSGAIRSKVALLRDMVALLQRKKTGCGLAAQRVRALTANLKRLLQKLQQDFMIVARCVHARDSVHAQGGGLSLNTDAPLPPFPPAPLPNSSDLAGQGKYREEDSAGMLPANPSPTSDSQPNAVTEAQDEAVTQQASAYKTRSDYIDALVDLALDAEFTELQRASHRIERYVTYGEALDKSLLELGDAFEEQVGIVSRVLELDTRCLALGAPKQAWKKSQQHQQPQHKSNNSGKSSARPISAITRMPQSTRPDEAGALLSPQSGSISLSTLKLRDLFICDHKLRRRAMLFGQHADACLEQETAKCRALLRQTRVRLRAAAAHSQQQLEAIRQERSANQSRLPLLRRRREELKRALESYLAPIELCRKRYELRLAYNSENFEGPDGISKLLEEELAELQSKVDVLLADLDATAEDLRGVYALDEALAAHYESESMKAKMFLKFVRERAGTSPDKAMARRALQRQLQEQQQSILKSRLKEELQMKQARNKNGNVTVEESSNEDNPTDVDAYYPHQSSTKRAVDFFLDDDEFDYGPETVNAMDLDTDFDLDGDSYAELDTQDADLDADIVGDRAPPSLAKTLFQHSQSGQARTTTRPTSAAPANRNPSLTTASSSTGKASTRRGSAHNVLYNLHPDVAIHSVGSSMVNRDGVTELAVAAASRHGAAAVLISKEPQLPASILKSGYFKLKKTSAVPKVSQADTLPLSAVQGSGTFEAQVQTLQAYQRYEAKVQASRNERRRVQGSARTRPTTASNASRTTSSSAADRSHGSQSTSTGNSSGLPWRKWAPQEEDPSERFVLSTNPQADAFSAPRARRPGSAHLPSIPSLKPGTNPTSFIFM